jgi:ATP synthase F1 complex assembly factor 1
MIHVADKYSAFVVPVPKGEKETACEFYFMQWGFHGSPPAPSASEPFASTRIHQHPLNPQTSTILFTPLQEYKLRASFATPYFVVTHYTDFARTHGIVLLRGEITPSAGMGRYFLSQEDSQMLAIGVQKFYLWGGTDGEGEGEEARLLKVFHETPEEFRWEELLKHIGMSA